MTARKFFLYFVFVSVTISCKSIKEVSKTEYIVIPVNKQLTLNDAASDSIIKPYSDKLSGYMNFIIGYSDTMMWTGKPESLLGNFITDLLKEEADKCATGPSDMAIFNNGGLRVPINKGAITRASIFKLMPFENEVVILKMKGTYVKELMDYIATSGGQPISGAKIGIKNSASVNILIGGQPLDTAKYYKIVTSDYLARGGDKMVFFLKRSDMYQTGLKVRDAIIKYIEDKNKFGQKITGRTDGRIYNVQL